MTKDNSGPAFPVEGYAMDASGSYCGDVVTSEGITKREYIAIEAMQGMLVNAKATDANSIMGLQETIAKLSYQMADAMLKAGEE